MASGFFLGGFGKGVGDIADDIQKQRFQNAQLGLLTNKFEYEKQKDAAEFQQKERKLSADQMKEFRDQAKLQADGLLNIIKEASSHGDPMVTQRVVETMTPVLSQLEGVYQRNGGAANAFTAQASAYLKGPTAGEKGAAEGGKELASAEGGGAKAAGMKAEAIAKATLPTELAKMAASEAMKNPEKAFTQANTLRDEFIKQSEGFTKVQGFYQNIQDLSKDPSAVGDIGVIFSYMKMLDPASTVREGEQATAQNAAGIDDRIKNMYNKLLTGERFQPNQRQEFIAAAGKIYNQQLAAHGKRVTEYQRLAKKAQLDPSMVIVDVTSGEDDPSKKTTEELLRLRQQAAP